MSRKQTNEVIVYLFLLMVVSVCITAGVLVNRYLESPERIEAIKAGLQECKVDAAIVWQRDCLKEAK